MRAVVVLLYIEYINVIYVNMCVISLETVYYLSLYIPIFLWDSSRNSSFVIIFSSIFAKIYVKNNGLYSIHWYIILKIDNLSISLGKWQWYVMSH